MKLDTAIDDNCGWMRNLVIGNRRRVSAGVSDRIVAWLRGTATIMTCCFERLHESACSDVEASGDEPQHGSGGGCGCHDSW